jgi:hypothetical protein
VFCYGRKLKKKKKNQRVLVIYSVGIGFFVMYFLDIDACFFVLKALEEVEKNFGTMRCMLCGDGEAEPNMDQVRQLVQEICKEDIIALLVHKLPTLGWEVSFFRNFSEHFVAHMA